MCIAILSEFGVDLPTKEVLRRCWDKNSDGAGFAYLTVNDTWMVEKGLMKFKHFWKRFKSHNFTSENTVLIHFRVGTSGRIDYGKCYPGCTHPFPVSDKEEELMSLKYEHENIIMHNGVVGGGDGNLSDTQEAIRDYVYPLIDKIEDKKFRKIMCHCLETDLVKGGSRWFVATGPTYRLLGNWILDDETKIWYSNSGYIYAPPVVIKSTSYTPWNAWSSTNNQFSDIKKVLSYVACDFEPAKEDDGIWDWTKWRNIDRSLMIDWKEWKKETESKAVKTTVSKPAVETEIFDVNCNLVGIVDQDGDVIWSDPTIKPEGLEKETRYRCSNCWVIMYDSERVGDGFCPTCGEYCTALKSIVCKSCEIDMDEADLNDGKCPYCSVSVIHQEDKNEIECPNCLSLDRDDTWQEGKSLCTTCGCAYKQDNWGDLHIVDWDINAAKNYRRTSI
jgi:hypothetical protein